MKLELFCAVCNASLTAYPKPNQNTVQMQLLVDPCEACFEALASEPAKLKVAGFDGMKKENDYLTQTQLDSTEDRPDASGAEGPTGTPDNPDYEGFQNDIRDMEEEMREEREAIQAESNAADNDTFGSEDNPNQTFMPGEETEEPQEYMNDEVMKQQLDYMRQKTTVTEWEEGFIESAIKWNGNFTEKMRATAEKIYNKYKAQASQKEIF